MELLIEILAQSWAFLIESTPYLLLGFAAAGLLHGFVSADFVAAHLGRGRFGPVMKAALLGVPLPLCSCGVLPAAMGLRSKGATKGATLSFLVSTPETGVDSIAITYALIDPIMTVVRPVAALVTAISAGLVETLFGRESKPIESVETGCGCGSEGDEVNGRPVGQRVRHGMEFAFGELLPPDAAPRG